MSADIFADSRIKIMLAQEEMIERFLSEVAERIHEWHDDDLWQEHNENNRMFIALMRQLGEVRMKFHCFDLHYESDRHVTESDKLWLLDQQTKETTDYLRSYQIVSF